MKRFMCAAVIAGMAIAPMQAQAGELGALISGGIVGGFAGSVYASGMAATVNSVSAAVSSAAATLPAAASGTAAVVAATSAPVLFGVAAGGVAALLLYNLIP